MQRKQSSAAPEDKVTKHLKIIIRLLIEKQISDKKMGMNDAILIMKSMGLGPTDIGQIIGWQTGAVGTVLARAKKANKK